MEREKKALVFNTRCPSPNTDTVAKGIENF